MPDGFQVVSARLLDTLVRVDRCVARRAGQVLAVLVGDVLALRIFKALGKPEINDVDLVFSLVRSSDEEVVWLDIAVDNSLLVHLLDAHQHLSRDQEDRLEVKLPLTRLKQILE